MGEQRETISLIRMFLMIISGFGSFCLSTGAIESATTFAPRETKKERKIQSAIDASADVAMLLKDMENRMDMASQKEI